MVLEIISYIEKLSSAGSSREKDLEKWASKYYGICEKIIDDTDHKGHYAPWKWQDEKWVRIGSGQILTCFASISHISAVRGLFWRARGVLWGMGELQESSFWSSFIQWSAGLFSTAHHKEEEVFPK